MHYNLGHMGFSFFFPVLEFLERVVCAIRRMEKGRALHRIVNRWVVRYTRVVSSFRISKGLNTCTSA